MHPVSIAVKRPSFVDPGTPLMYTEASEQDEMLPDEDYTSAGHKASNIRSNSNQGLGVDEDFFSPPRVASNIASAYGRPTGGKSGAHSSLLKSWRSWLLQGTLHPIALIPAILLGMCMVLVVRAPQDAQSLLLRTKLTSSSIGHADTQPHANGHLYLSSQDMDALDEHPIQGLIRNATQE